MLISGQASLSKISSFRVSRTDVLSWRVDRHVPVNLTPSIFWRIMIFSQNEKLVHIATSHAIHCNYEVIAIWSRCPILAQNLHVKGQEKKKGGGDKEVHMNKVMIVAVLAGALLLSSFPDTTFAAPSQTGKKAGPAQTARIGETTRRVGTFPTREETAKFTPPGFIQLLSQDDSIFLVARKDIKPEYADPCTTVTWEGEPEKFFAKNVADAIRLARPAERQNREMHMGVLVRGDLNLCRIREGLSPVRGFCPGGAVETGAVLPNLGRQIYGQSAPRVVNREDIGRSSEEQQGARQGVFSAIRSLFTRAERTGPAAQPLWQSPDATGAVAINTTAIEGLEELPIIFYEPCEDFPARSTESDRCGPGPAPSGVSLYGVQFPGDRTNVGFPEGDSFAGSPIGPDSTSDRSGWASGGGGDRVNFRYGGYDLIHHTQTRRVGADSDVGRQVSSSGAGRDTNQDGYISARSDTYVEVYGDGNYTMRQTTIIEGGVPVRTEQTGNLTDPKDKNARTIERWWVQEGSTRVGVEDCSGSASGSSGNINCAPPTTNGNAGRPMCDFASSDACGGEYTFGSFPIPDPLMDNLPSTHRDGNQPVDCFDEFCEGGGEIPEFIPGTRISTVMNDPLAPYVNPAFDDAQGAGGSAESLPCGVLAVDVSYTYSTDCMDPMDTNCWQPLRRNIDQVTQPAGRHGRQNPQVSPAGRAGARGEVNRPVMRNIERAAPQGR